MPGCTTASHLPSARNLRCSGYGSSITSSQFQACSRAPVSGCRTRSGRCRPLAAASTPFSHPPCQSACGRRRLACNICLCSSGMGAKMTAGCSLRMLASSPTDPYTTSNVTDRTCMHKSLLNSLRNQHGAEQVTRPRHLELDQRSGKAIVQAHGAPRLLACHQRRVGREPTQDVRSDSCMTGLLLS